MFGEVEMYVTFNFPERDFEVVGEDKAHPVVVHQDVVRRRHGVGSHS